MEKTRELYRATYSKPVDLIHTSLEVTPDWESHTLKGKATLTLKPHFYPINEVRLDARQFILHHVEVKKNGIAVAADLKYDSLKIMLHFPVNYSSADTLQVAVDYTAQPEKINEEGSASIKSNRGLYFIDPDSLDPLKPTQLWTQGETESNSGWFPTIESPEQKMTQDISITVDSAFTTLSNGLLISSQRNADGTRTDHWKQSLPAAPYLTMIAVGNFAKVSERWRDLEVSYYVDPPYEKMAKMIFGHTREMMDHFSQLLGVDYPWEKYAQIVVHDYISGAMENTTAVVHGTNMQQDQREYVDYNFENYIAHELFHHWFGDLVTCESWSNLTLNEGFANYSEYLWNEYKFGRDEADYQLKSDMDVYLNRSEKRDPPLINYQYIHREDMYNAVTYNKGGCVLHMLRKYTGDKAFFTSLKYYLDQHRFGTVELADLRLAFEKVTGEDLNWFFNQWFLNKGYPVLNISHSWNEETKTLDVKIAQKQDLSVQAPFRLPMDVAIYLDNSLRMERIIVDSPEQTFRFNLPSAPKLVNVDEDKMLLGKKTVEQSEEEWIYQYFHAPKYMDRYEAFKKLTVNYTAQQQTTAVVLAALNDKHHSLRRMAIEAIDPIAKNDPEKVKNKLIDLAISDSVSAVREAAIFALSKYYPYPGMKSLFEKAIYDLSYDVEAAAFTVISRKDSELANELAPKMEKDTGSAIYAALSDWYKKDTFGKLNFFEKGLRLTKYNDRYTLVRNMETYLSNAEAKEIENGVKMLAAKRLKEKNRHYKSSLTTAIQNVTGKVRSRIDQLERDIKAGQPASKSELSELKTVYTRIENILE